MPTVQVQDVLDRALILEGQNVNLISKLEIKTAGSAQGPLDLEASETIQVPFVPIEWAAGKLSVRIRDVRM